MGAEKRKGLVVGGPWAATTAIPDVHRTVLHDLVQFLVDASKQHSDVAEKRAELAGAGGLELQALQHKRAARAALQARITEVAKSMGLKDPERWFLDDKSLVFRKKP